MNCPKCGNNGIIKRGTRISAKMGGKVLQQYQCKKCGHTFVPKETTPNNSNIQEVEVKSPVIPLPQSPSTSIQNNPGSSTTDVNTSK